MKYYPGDEQINWWAINIFDLNERIKKLISRFIGDAEIRKNPVVIVESTPRIIDTNNEENIGKPGFSHIFTFIKKHKHTESFVVLTLPGKIIRIGRLIKITDSIKFGFNGPH